MKSNDQINALEYGQRGAAKTAKNPVKVSFEQHSLLRKPAWIRVKVPNNNNVADVKRLLRKAKLNTVCEEASCPNLPECFGHGTATFMILGSLCTRRCPFCDVAHGRPLPPDVNEPENLARAIQSLALKHVVITSVDRDDLKDGGAGHFAQCIAAVRDYSPSTRIEVLVPDFRGRLDKALAAFVGHAPDIFNHNLETVPRLYKRARPGADYQWSLQLLKAFKHQNPDVPTKSGLMVGLGEQRDELDQVMIDLRTHDVDMLTVGQYLAPSRGHLPVEKYWAPDEFRAIKQYADELGFTQVASGPMVRSSYHADLQASGGLVN